MNRFFSFRWRSVILTAFCVVAVACFSQALSLRAQAQSINELLYGELRFDFKPTNMQTKSISYYRDGDGNIVGWVQLYGVSGCKSRRVPDLFIEDAKEVCNTGYRVESITFTPEQDWIIIYNTNGYSMRLGSKYSELEEWIKYYNNRRQPIKSVAVNADGGWALVWGKNGYRYRNIPQGMADRFKELVAYGHTINRASFGRDPNGWIITHGNGGFMYEKFYRDEALAFVGDQAHEESAANGLDRDWQFYVVKRMLP